MAVLQATRSHLPQIEELLLLGRHVYSAQPHVDVADLIRRQICVVGRSGNSVWGFASLEPEERPLTLRTDDPSRYYLSTMALHNGRSPFADIPCLIDEIVRLAQAANTVQQRDSLNAYRSQMIAYGHQPWLVKPLEQANFHIVERVEFFVRDRLQRRVLPSSQALPAKFRVQLAQSSQLRQIAEVDALAFPPLWHMGEAQLQSLWTSHRMVVLLDGEHEAVVGYTALAMVDESEPSARESSNHGGQPLGRHAHLARIAVSPNVQGHGLGQHLLIDCLQFAQKQGVNAVHLNTQTSNEASRQLYKRFGFSRTGQIYPVLVRDV